MRRRRASERALAARDPIMAELIERLGPCTLPTRRRGEPFESLLRSVISQRVSTAAARSVQARVAAALGDALTPEALLDLEAEALQACGLPRTKVRALRGLAEAVLAGMDLRALGRRPSEEIRARLVALPGIGPWTVNMHLIFHLGRPDVFPAGDLGVQEGLRRAFQLEARPSAAEARERAAPWAPYRSTAAWYLWRALDGPAEL